MTLTRPTGTFARPITFPQRIANTHAAFPRPGLAGGFPRPFAAGAGFPRPNAIGGSFPHTASLNAGHPKSFPQGSIGGPLRHGALSASANRPQSPAGGAAPGSRLHSAHFSIGSIPVIGAAVNAAAKTVGDIAKGDLQKVPGDLAAGPIKVVKGTIDQLSTKPAKVSEPKGSTTSDKDFTPAPKMSMVQTALLIKQINDMKAAQAAKQAQQSQVKPDSTPAKPADQIPPRPMVLNRLLEFKLNREEERNRILKTQLAAAIGQARQNQVFGPRQAGLQPVMSGMSGSRPIFQGGGQSAGSAPAFVAPAPAVAPVQAALPPLPANGPATSTQAASTPVVAPQPAAGPATAQAMPAAEPPVVLVGFKQDISAADLAAFLQAYKVSIVEGPNADGVYKLRLNDRLPANLLSQFIDSIRGQTNIVTSAAFG